MKGSMRHICWYVNETPEVLNAALFSATRSLAAAAAADPTWVSPLADEDYEECWNERFLERLDLLASTSTRSTSSGPSKPG